jgi:hypothetical protein
MNATICCAAASLLAAAAAQAPMSPVLPATALAGPLQGVCAPIHSQPEDAGQPYGQWAAGDGYKVGFADGLRFVPYHRSDGPAVDWRWRTVSARAGEQELVTQAPRAALASLRAEYDLGGLVEAYDVRPDGVEQTFVLRQRPASAGDLVIRGAVQSVLEAAPDGNGIGFVDASGVPLVRYGRALAIDANGSTAAMTTTLVDGGLELRLAGEWLATAAFPLVVDPLIAPVTVVAGVPIAEVAIAHDPFGSKNLWVAEVRYAGGDADLWLWRTDADGQNPILAYSDLSASWSAIEPSLGISRGGASTLLAYTRDVLSNQRRVLRLHDHSRFNLAFEGTVLFPIGPTNRNCWRPTVGHDLAIGSSTLLVAFQVEEDNPFSNVLASAIYGLEVDCAGAGSFGSAFAIAEQAAVDHERPSLAKVNGSAREWTVAYQRYQHFLPNGFSWDAALRRINPGNVVSAEFLIDTATAGQHEMTPKLAGHDDRLMLFTVASTIAESAQKPQGSAGHRIRGTRLEWNGAGYALPHGSRTLQSNGDPRLELGGADFDFHSGSHFALTFRSNATETLYLRTYGYQGLELGSDVIDQPTTGIGRVIAGGVCFQASNDEFIAGYGIDDPGVTSASRIRRRTYTGLFPVSTGGSACIGTQLGWYGSRLVGTEQCGFQFTNAPANTFTVVLLATTSASLQLFGIDGVHDGCWLLVPLGGPDYLGMLGPIVGANGSWQVSLPETLPNVALRGQAVTFDPAFGEFFSSSRVTAPIGY